MDSLQSEKSKIKIIKTTNMPLSDAELVSSDPDDLDDMLVQEKQDVTFTFRADKFFGIFFLPK